MWKASAQVMTQCLKWPASPFQHSHITCISMAAEIFCQRVMLGPSKDDYGILNETKRK